MFDDLDDDDLTDLIPDKEENETDRQRQQGVRGRRMTVSEVCIHLKYLIFLFFLMINLYLYVDNTVIEELDQLVSDIYIAYLSSKFLLSINQIKSFIYH